MGGCTFVQVIVLMLGVSSALAPPPEDIESPSVGLISEDVVTVTPGFAEKGRRIRHAFGEVYRQLSYLGG